MSSEGNVTYVVRHGASTDGYPTSREFSTLQEAVVFAVERSKNPYCLPITVIKNIVIKVLESPFEEIVAMMQEDPDPPIEQERCHCGDPAWGTNGCCGVSGCSNVPC